MEMLKSKIMNIEIKNSDEKDHYHLTINKIYLGQLERSDLRYIIQKIDNKI